MIDNFALALTHGLIALAFWRLLQSDALDRDAAPDSEAEADTPAPAPGGKRPRA